MLGAELPFPRGLNFGHRVDHAVHLACLKERGAMRTLNRAAFVVTPKEPYLRWAASLGEDAPEEGPSQ